ncbi:testis-specific serine/threonine-protein kinase 6 [Labrus bergylta]|uniref:testis-specific serine/threonine-protein kinase 6 n=1 Tax=Labrus bergylta TaxID=56723 RepID=UPI003313B8C0
MNYKAFLETRGYTFKRNLGEGTYGKVVSAYCKDRRRKVAIKVIDKEEVSSNYLEKFLPREMKIIRTLRHPNIVKTYDIFGLNSTKVYVVMELCGKGNLLRYINHHGALSEPLSCRLFTQLCKAIKYLHKKYVAHRDLKCENLLLDRHYNLKVCDFGFSKRLMYRHGNMVLSETYCGSWSYTAPEVLRGLPYNPKLSDVWSMGVVLYVFIYALMPFDTSNVIRLVEIQMKHKIHHPDVPSVSSEAEDLIQGILHPDVEQRITIRNILCHPWMLRKWEMEDTDEAPLSNPGSRQEGQPDENTKEEEEPTQESSDPGEGPSTCAPR